jgi:hypothetical protein
MCNVPCLLQRCLAQDCAEGREARHFGAGLDWTEPINKKQTIPLGATYVTALSVGLCTQIPLHKCSTQGAINIIACRFTSNKALTMSRPADITD